MRIGLTVAVLLALSACQQGPSAEELAKQKAAKMAHYSEIMLWRKDRIERLTKPDGWLSLVGMHWLPKNTVTRVGSGAANGTRLAVGPERLGLIKVNADNTVQLQPEAGVELTLDGRPLSGKTKLTADSQGAASVVGFAEGSASFIVIERGGKMALRVRDANAATRVKFTGIDYYPVDTAYRYKAKFTAHEAGRTIDIVNIIGQIEPMMNPGTVTFQIGEKSYTMEAIDEGDHRLFFTFADRTSGKESYAAARFMYAEYPGADGMTVLDFNKAYNPPCAFTAFSTCPMPPPENRLDFEVRAGEKKPRKVE
jgi:uncharacterized protein (DUF1684 family)